MLKQFFSAAVLATALFIPSIVSADVVNVDAGWYGFCFEGPGSPATAGCQNDGVGVSGNSTTFTAAGPVLFKITDAFLKGDTFTVNVDGGAMSFMTPTVAESSDATTEDPDLAFADPTYSHGSILLGAGSHSIDVFAANSPSGGGGAYLEVVSATSAAPEPASIALLAGGMAALLFAKRRLRN